MSRAFVLLAASLVNSTGDAGTGDAGNLNTTTNTDLLRNLPFHLTSLLSRDTEHSAEASNDRFAEFSYEFLPEQVSDLTSENISLTNSPSSPWATSTSRSWQTAPSCSLTTLTTRI